MGAQARSFVSKTILLLLREGTMRELFEPAIVYLRSNLLVKFAVALIAGGAACRSIASDRLSGPVVYCLIGIAGLFLSQSLFIQFDLVRTREEIGNFRMLVDFCAAYTASLFIAAIVNAINPS
jgi:uncharacterized membrane protein YeaQ/YmgE (transglycosylase-associated protein family)